MDKEETYSFLKEQGIDFEAVEHKAVYNMEDLDTITLPHPEAEAKNLFVRDDKKKHYYLITVKGDKSVDLKAFRKEHGLRNLSFASAWELEDKMHLQPGSVTPLGLLNEKEAQIVFYLDQAFCDALIGMHPNDNTATVWLQSGNLIRLLQEHGNEVHLVTIP